MPLSYRNRTRYWIPLLFLIALVGSWYDAGAHAMAWAAARAGIIFFMLWQIIDNNGRAFDKIHTDNDERRLVDKERFHMMQGTRLAGESLASTLEIILGIVNTLRAELAKNTTLTNESARAGAEAAQRALATAEHLATNVDTQRDALARALAADRQTADTAHREMKAAVADVHDAAQSAYHEANDVNQKIKDVKQEISNLNERLLSEEDKLPQETTPTSAAEMSLQHIDEQTAAIDDKLTRAIHAAAATKDALTKHIKKEDPS